MIVNGIGLVSMGLLLIVPSETSLTLSVDRPASENAELLLAQCRSGRTGRARGPEDALIPYVISPRNTAVLSDRPDLYWNPIAGVDRYKVSLLNGDTVLWTKEVDTNRVAYPEEVEALQPGIDYTLVVEAANGRSSAEEDITPFFHVLSPSEAEVIRQAETLFAAQPNTEETVLLKADIYAGAELYSEAIATLEALVAQGTQSATVYRQLGDLYARSDLNIRAEPYYLDAIALAAENPEKQARAQAALGDLYMAIGQNQEAVRYFTQAQENYQMLNNQFRVQEIEEQLTNLGSQT